MRKINYYWDDLFEDDEADQRWFVVYQDGRRVVFDSTDADFPLNISEYRMGDEDRLVADLQKHYPNYEIVRC